MKRFLFGLLAFLLVGCAARQSTVFASSSASSLPDLVSIASM
jgi:hypothetical protein